MNTPPLPPDSVILFGSGVSMWAPSDIPTGAQVRDALLDILFSTELLEWERSNLRRWLNWIPFETINECAPPSVNLKNFYAKHLATSQFNELHRQLAQLGASRRVVALITTNYDCGVEAAAGTSPIWPVLDPIGPTPAGVIPLFKIHGSTDRPETLVYRLAQEAVLSEQKSKYLYALLAGRTLVVIGYSGVDFEICPVIATSQAKQVIWCYQSGNALTDYQTPGFRAIASAIATQPFPIDLSAGLPWYSTQVTLCRSTGRNINTDLASLLGEEERGIWALRLASSIGYATLAQKLLRELQSASHSVQVVAESQKQEGYALFQAGCYRTAARAFLRTARDARRTRDYEERISAVLDACDAWRAGGHYARAVASFLLAQVLALRHASPKTACRLALKEALLLKSIMVGMQPRQSSATLSRTVRLSFARLLHRRGRRLVASARRHSAEAGQVFDQKQLDELEGIFVPSDASRSPSPDGYAHLGYLAASTTLFRIRVLRAPLPTAIEDEAQEHYKLMCILGNNPEAWKVAARMAELTFGSTAHEWELRNQDHLQRCEYTRRHRSRLTHWIRGGATIEQLDR